MAKRRKGRSQKVDIMIVGEAPGADEAKYGIPFVGKSGQLLRAGLSFIMGRSYLTNVVKCRPPLNVISPDYIQFCLPYLMKEIKILKPDYIIAVGRTALEAVLFEPGESNRLYRRTFYGKETKIISIVHPAYILRSGSVDEWKEAIEFVRRNVDGNADQRDNREVPQSEK